MIVKPPTYEHALTVDSCLSGAGGHLGNLWYSTKFPPELVDMSLSISQLEMINVMAAIRVFAKDMAGHTVIVRCDNMAAVAVLESGRGHCPVLLQCARQVWKVTAEHKIEIQVRHVPGIENGLADLLSRAHLSNHLKAKLDRKINEENPIMYNIGNVMFRF